MELWFFTVAIWNSHKTIYKGKLGKLPPEKTHICQQSCALNLYLSSSVYKMITVLLSFQSPLAAQIPVRLNEFPVSEYVYNSHTMYTCVNPDVMFSQASALLTLRIQALLLHKPESYSAACCHKKTIF